MQKTINFLISIAFLMIPGCATQVKKKPIAKRSRPNSTNRDKVVMVQQRLDQMHPGASAGFGRWEHFV